MENKPIITCHGDQVLFSKMHSSLVQALPREAVEWRRSYGRPARRIYVEANFVAYKDSVFPPENDWTLLARPFFHIYWTDCDIDTYKSKVKDEITGWTASLKARGISDWFIVHVVQDGSKVKTKLLRTSVYDKIKSDFCGKSSEKCFALYEPFKSDTKSAESWFGLILRLRQMLLTAYNKMLGRFEEHMRTQRENRTESGWNFFNYFILQEELAFMFEMLGLFEDAMVQYDELDALFTQFVLNHAAGVVKNEVNAPWLTTMAKLGCPTWDGLSLNRPINIEKRTLIQQHKASLLDFRNYLFSRQATLLFLMHRPWEVSQRSIPFMHHCMKELALLEVNLPPGALCCWVFLNCLEVLATCERFTDSGQMETYSLHTASLWDYARQKLTDLGDLCGLMPDLEPSSSQLNLVVDLTSGMTRTAGSESSEPLKKLREALSSKEAFHKHYLELSELAMGTYKHIGRIRSARFIGQDLANFYMRQGDARKAEGFWADALKMLKTEGWAALVDDTRLKIAECQKLLQDQYKYLKSCCHLASSTCLPSDVTQRYHKELMQLAGAQDKKVLLPLRPVFKVIELEIKASKYILHKEITVVLYIHCRLPEPVSCDSVSIILAETSEEDGQSEEATTEISLSKSRKISVSSLRSIGGFEHLDNISAPKGMPPLLDLKSCLDMKNEDGVSVVGIVSNRKLLRPDSGSNLRDKDMKRADSTISLSATDVQVVPGENTITLTGKVPHCGLYTPVQVAALIQKLEFLQDLPHDCDSNILVVSDKPSIKLEPAQAPLVAGLSQLMKIVINSGSFSIDEGTELRLNPSDGLVLSGEHLSGGCISLPAAEPYQSLEVDVLVICELDNNGPQHYDKEVVICSGLLDHEEKHQLQFHHPFRLVHKLHTSGQKKYIQVLVHGIVNQPFKLSQHNLSCSSKDVELVPFNKHDQTLNVTSEQSASYLWQLKSNISETPPLDCTFCVTYCVAEVPDPKTHQCRLNFTVCQYKTLYKVVSEIEPTTPGTTSQIGEVSQMTISVSALDTSSESLLQLLMYQAQTNDKDWAICGKTSGVFTLDQDGKYTTQLDVMPLSGGYLHHPTVSIVKYTPASSERSTITSDIIEKKGEGSELPLLEPFSQGQIYNASTAKQVHVYASNNPTHVDISITA